MEYKNIYSYWIVLKIRDGKVDENVYYWVGHRVTFR